MAGALPIDECKAAFRRVILSFGAETRFTQDSPILTDVWMAFVELDNVPLILVPHYRSRTAELAVRVQTSLSSQDFGRGGEGVWDAFVDGGGKDARRAPAPFARVAALSNDILVAMTFDELMGKAVPLTEWWQLLRETTLTGIRRAVNEAVLAFEKARNGSPGAIAVDKVRDTLVAAFRSSSHKDIWRFFAVAGLVDHALRMFPLEAGDGGKVRDANRDVIRDRWRHIGAISLFLDRIGNPAAGDFEIDIPDDYDAYLEGAAKLVSEFAARKAAELSSMGEELRAGSADRPIPQGASLGRNPVAIWRINMNRSTVPSVAESRKTVKADAATRVFDLDMAGITWAVVDSGIDATHLAFQDRSDDAALARRVADFRKVPDTKRQGARWQAVSAQLAKGSRVVATFDFNRLQAFMAGDASSLLAENDAIGRKVVDALCKGGEGRPGMPRAKAIVAYLILRSRYQYALPENVAAKSSRVTRIDREVMAEVDELLDDIKRRVLIGREIEWRLLEPIIALPHDLTYQPPRNAHGTHVAGTLCGDLRRGDLTPPTADSDFDVQPSTDMPGVCPTLKVIDMRVCDDAGGGEEFVVLAALQFIAYLNRDRDKMQIQGVNLSLSLRHDVENFACGRTPVCLECERLTENGVVVVAAAGNRGFSTLSTMDGKVENYQSITITDPGNAAGVITVGATHRKDPHAYGVSYFSSRGPTGDGRQKPDLVAPGEKITAPVPNFKIDTMDGTSMAAPHVSGAAAALMARHPELIRRPARIKEILCATATDLGRERRFQGAGLVDLLRALQAV